MPLKTVREAIEDHEARIEALEHALIKRDEDMAVVARLARVVAWLLAIATGLLALQDVIRPG